MRETVLVIAAPEASKPARSNAARQLRGSDIACLMPVMGIEGADAFVWRQVGYSLADVLAKCLFGLLIYKIAREKSSVDSAEFNEAELEEAPSSR